MLCIDAALLGTERHLYYTGGDVAWCSEVPRDTWYFSGQVKDYDDWCFDSLLKLANVEIDVLPPKKFIDAYSSLNVQDLPPWRWILPSEVHKQFIRRVLDEALGVMPKLPESYFETVWRTGNRLLKSLLRARVDRFKINSLLEANDGNQHIVKTFLPDNTAYAQQTYYDRLGTVTGRLRVSSGPNILTLKRENRSILLPSTTNGNIVMLDFAALEARILLYEAGRRCDEQDLYGSIAKELGYERKAVKLAVLSSLYGSSKNSLGERLGIFGTELDNFVSKVGTFFNTAGLLKRVKSGFIADGFIRNRHGKRVNVEDPLDNIFISYYGQSTGVDVTILGFESIVQKLKLEAPKVRSLFLLHDALVLDVPKECMQIVNSIDKVSITGYVQPFKLTSQVVEQNTEVVERYNNDASHAGRNREELEQVPYSARENRRPRRSRSEDGERFG